MAVQVPRVGLDAAVDNGEADEIALGDELVRDGRVPEAVDRLPEGRARYGTWLSGQKTRASG